MTTRLCSLLVLLPAFLFACGAESPAPSGNGGGGSDAAVEECQGCFNSEGECLSGEQDLACGGGGESCRECAAGETCSEGECLLPPSCDESNCTGCCDGDTCVQPGEQDGEACGQEGNACTSCPSGMCQDGACVEACGPNTCSGCCAGPTIDDCVEVGNAQSANECGSGGLACETCSSTSTCAQGSCVETSCSLDCPQGCCDGTTCRDGDSDDACGTGGEACFSCGEDQACSEGVCVVDPDSLWDFVVVNAELPLTDSNGDAWDFGGGAPDGQVYVDLGEDTPDAREGISAEIENQFFPKFNEPNGETVIEGFKASALLDHMRIRVYDVDINADDLISNVSDPAPPETIFSGNLFQLEHPDNGTVVRFRVVKAE